MRHSDSAQGMRPVSFVALGGRYQVRATFGFDSRRTPGAASTATGLVSRCPPTVRALRRMTTRPPGFPGNRRVVACHDAPTPAWSTPPRPLRCARDNLPSNARRGRLTNHAFRGTSKRPAGSQSNALSPWVTAGPRITRMRLAGDAWLGRDWIPTGFRTRFQRSHHGILSPLTGLSRHTRWCMTRHCIVNDPNPEASHRPKLYGAETTELGPVVQDVTRDHGLAPLARLGTGVARRPASHENPVRTRENAFSSIACERVAGLRLPAAPARIRQCTQRIGAPRRHTMPSAQAVGKRAGGARPYFSQPICAKVTGHFFRLYLRPRCPGSGDNQRIL